MSEAVQDKIELIKRIQSARLQITSYGVIRLGIFGSFAKNLVTKNSDVDFFVEFDPERKTFDNFMELAFYLEELTGRRIELITPESLNKYIGKYIVKEVEYVPFAA